MEYRIGYKANNKMSGTALGDVTLDGEIGLRFDRFIHERVSGEFAINEILREAEDCFRDKFDDETLEGQFRSEFWGKLIISACRVCRYKNDGKLKEDIRKSAYRMLTFREPNGFLSTYRDSTFLFKPDPEACKRDLGRVSILNWNIWGRKYTIWGMIECAMLLDDSELLDACILMADHMIDELKTLGISIKQTGSWDGMPSGSIIKPMLILYRLTGNERYLDFCLDIVNDWDREDGECPNLIRNAFKDMSPADWYDKEKTSWMAKAYELMSCFEGVLELYRITGTERYLEACEALYKNLIKYESNIGGSVGYADLFCNAADYADMGTEICDVIHWMRYCYELYCTTGNAVYMESFERAFLNAFLAGYNHGCETGAFIVRGAGRHWTGLTQCETKYQQCCLNNVPRGFANAAQAAVMEGGDGYYVNLYAMSTSRFGDTLIRVGKGYADNGFVAISVRAPKEGKLLYLRIPSWSSKLWIKYDGEETPIENYRVVNGYAAVPVSDGCVVRVRFDMTPRVIDYKGTWRDEIPASDVHLMRYIDPWNGLFTKEHMLKEPMAHIWRGPVLLARTKRLGATEEEMFESGTVQGKERTCTAEAIRPDHALTYCRVKLTSEGKEKNYIMCDYASAVNIDTDDVRYFTVYV